LQAQLEDARLALQRHIEKQQRRAEEKSLVRKQVFASQALASTNPVPFRIFGSLGEDLSWTLPADQYQDIADNYLRDPSFHPFKMVMYNGEPQKEVDETNPKLQQLEEEYGLEVKTQVLRALREMDVWNPSGRYEVLIPWHKTENRELKPSEIVKVIMKDTERCRAQEAMELLFSSVTTDPSSEVQ
jgi:hypothetical protein